MVRFAIRWLSASQLKLISGAGVIALLAGCTPMSERLGPSEIAHVDAGPFLEMSCEQLSARMAEVADADRQAATGGDPYWFNNPFHRPDNETLARTRGEMETLGRLMYEKNCSYQPRPGRIGY